MLWQVNSNLHGFVIIDKADFSRSLELDCQFRNKGMGEEEMKDWQCDP